MSSDNNEYCTKYPGMIGASLVNESIKNFITGVCTLINKEEIKYHFDITTNNPIHISARGIVTMDGEARLDSVIRKYINQYPQILDKVFNERQRSYALDYYSHWKCPCLATDSISYILSKDLYFKKTWLGAKATMIFNANTSMVYISNSIPVKKLIEDFDFDLLHDGWENDEAEYELVDEDIEEDIYYPSFNCLKEINNLRTSLFDWGSIKAFELVKEILKYHKPNEQIIKITI